MSTTIDVPAETTSKNNIGNGIRKVPGAPPRPEGGWKKGVAIMDFILRLGAIASALGAAATMATSDETLPFFTQFFQFEASYDSFSTFQYVTPSQIKLCFSLIINLHIISKILVFNYVSNDDVELYNRLQLMK